MPKIKKTKFRNLTNGKIIYLWPTTEHFQSNYNMPVWVDKDNYCWGQCVLWPVPFGLQKAD